MVKTAGAAMPRALLLLGLDAGAEMCYEQARKRDEPTTTTRKGARRLGISVWMGERFHGDRPTKPSGNHSINRSKMEKKQGSEQRNTWYI